MCLSKSDGQFPQTVCTRELLPEQLQPRAFEAFDFAVVFFNQDDVGLVDEEAVVDDAGDVVEFGGELGEVLVAAQTGIEDEVAVVGDEEAPVHVLTDDAVDADVAQGVAGGDEPESHDGDGERGAGADL